MLECLKKMNRIIIILFLMISVAYASIPKENREKQETDLVDYIINIVDAYVQQEIWCFDHPNCDNNKQVLKIGIILEKYGWTTDEYYIACTLMYNMEDNTKYLALFVILRSKINPDANYVGNWIIIEPVNIELEQKNGPKSL